MKVKFLWMGSFAFLGAGIISYSTNQTHHVGNQATTTARDVAVVRCGPVSSSAGTRNFGGSGSARFELVWVSDFS